MIVIGVGNAWRGDDGCGLAVARRVASAAPAGVEVAAHEGDGVRLIDLWAGAPHAVVVDAAVSRGRPGTVYRFDAVAGPLPVASLRSSSHAFGVADAVELARALDRLPPRLDVYGIEGAAFGAGARLTPAVAEAVATLADRLCRAGG